MEQYLAYPKSILRSSVPIPVFFSAFQKLQHNLLKTQNDYFHHTKFTEYIYIVLIYLSHAVPELSANSHEYPA